MRSLYDALFVTYMLIPRDTVIISRAASSVWDITGFRLQVGNKQQD